MNKKTANDVIDRLKVALGVESDSDLCKLINVGRATLGNWRSRDSVPYSICVDLSESNKLSLDWLLTGKGEMYAVSLSAAPTVNMKAIKMAELLDALNEDQQKEILAVIAEKNNLMR